MGDEQTDNAGYPYDSGNDEHESDIPQVCGQLACKSGKKGTL